MNYLSMFLNECLFWSYETFRCSCKMHCDGQCEHSKPQPHYSCHVMSWWSPTFLSHRCFTVKSSGRISPLNQQIACFVSIFALAFFWLLTLTDLAVVVPPSPSELNQVVMYAISLQCLSSFMFVKEKKRATKGQSVLTTTQRSPAQLCQTVSSGSLDGQDIERTMTLSDASVTTYISFFILLVLLWLYILPYASMTWEIMMEDGVMKHNWKKKKTTKKKKQTKWKVHGSVNR